MNDREQITVEPEARRRVGDPRQGTGYGRAIRRCLGAFSYVDPYADRRAPEHGTTPEPARS